MKNSHIKTILILVFISFQLHAQNNSFNNYGAAYQVQYINKPGCIPPIAILTGTGNAPSYTIVNECCIDSTIPFYDGVEIVILKPKTKSVDDKKSNQDFDFSNNEKQSIHNIAAQCPYSGGTGVIEARAIQRHWNDTIFYNDEMQCQLSIQISKHGNKGKEETKIGIYPNPSNDLIFLKASVTGIAIITDITGRMVLVAVVNSNLTEINIKGINEGVYLFTLYSNNKPLDSTRITIIR